MAMKEGTVMETNNNRYLAAVGIVLLGALLWSSCQDKYERLPEATAKELEALSERYLALVEEAKKLKDTDSMKLLHHFSHAALSSIQPDAFNALAKKYIAQATSGELDKVKIKGARSPGKVRVLLVDAPEGSGIIPFVQSADGWKIDDIGPAFLDFSKEPNLEGNMPAQPPSSLASIVVLQDPQASETDVVQAAIILAASKNKATAETYAASEKKPWAKAALLFAVWKSGGSCDSFAEAFPIDGEKQKELYDSDTESYRTMLKGLTECAGESDKPDAALKVYRGCYKVEGGARSEYVDPVVELANKKPEYIVKAALKTKFKYEEDPVANIVVGAIHGEKEMAFHQYIHQKAKGGGKIGRLAQDWVEKMAKRDEMEPAGTHDGDKPAE
jgi:hypothetical protein